MCEGVGLLQISFRAEGAAIPAAENEEKIMRDRVSVEGMKTAHALAEKVHVDVDLKVHASPERVEAVV